MKQVFKKAVLGVALTAAAMIMPLTAAAEPLAVQNDSFNVTLPTGFGEFATQKQSTKAADGTIETTTWISKSITGEALVITVSKMPGKILDPAKLMASTKDSLLKSLNAEFESEQAVEGNLPAMNLRFKSGGAAFLLSRLMVDEDRLFQVLYVGRSDEQRNGDSVVGLFDSFQIAAKAAAEPVAPAAAPAADAATATTASNQN